MALRCLNSAKRFSDKEKEKIATQIQTAIELAEKMNQKS